MAQPLRSIVLAAATLLALGLGGPSVAATRVGVTSAVNPDAVGLVPGLDTRILRVGVDNFADERITTGPSGQAQLLFLDGASLSVGADAEVKIDRFVYDPAGRLGTLALTATSGVMRFVGGAISKSSAVEIATPVATVGIRGGIALVDLKPGEPLVATMLYGARLSVTAGGVTQTVLRPGYSVTVTPGQPPSAPAPLSLAALKAELGALQGAKSTGAASGEPLQDAALARSAVSSATGSTEAADVLAASVTIAPKATETTDQAASEIVEHAARLQREAFNFGRFLSIYDYLDSNFLDLPLVNSNRIFGFQSLSGYVGGIIGFTRSDGTTGFSTIQAGSSAVIDLESVRDRVVGDFFVNTGRCCFDFAFGGNGPVNLDRSLYLAQNIFAARNSVTNTSTFTNQQAGTPAVALTSRAVMVSADALDIVVPGATPCACRFMTWGWWVGSYQFASGRVEAVNLGSWVVGHLPQLYELPQSGSATYVGQAVGNVVTPSGAQYLAGGTYQLSWNFASHAGTSTIANFDGVTLQGASSSTNGRDYTANLAGSAGGTSFTGSLAGSFYKGGDDPVLGTGGNFAFSSPAGYRAGGTFIARR
ncbi:MAG TPA: FecR domain-containing protein [Candidatus Sulfotelmatobacter sp.]|nr:FecR domain-containing protein [Candidatus Sulfotelmatobacter sp.]